MTHTETANSLDGFAECYISPPSVLGHTSLCTQWELYLTLNLKSTKLQVWAIRVAALTNNIGLEFRAGVHGCRRMG